MKKIKNRFAPSEYSRINALSAQYELRQRELKDIRFVRDKIASGKFTRSLYDFINKDGSLDRLLPNLPPPTDEVACEALSVVQLQYIDDIISQEELALSKWINIVWNALCDWWKTWFDRNRFLLKQLAYYKSLCRSAQDRYFGAYAVMHSTPVLMYSMDDWTKMCDAAKKLSSICKDIPDKRADLAKWININKPTINDNIAKFGMFIDELNKFQFGTPMFIRQNAVCLTLGWRYPNLLDDIKKASSILDEEIEARRSFYRLEKLFKDQGDSKRDLNLLFVKDFVMAAKRCSTIIGKTFDSFISQLMRSVASKYKIGS